VSIEIGSTEDRIALLREISEVHGVVGHEDDVRALMRDRLAGVGTISYDRQGSILCEKRGTADSPRVLLAGHMDEIGFLVKLVTDGGFLRITPVGGWTLQVLLAQRVVVHTAKGSFPGIIGSKPPHLMQADERNKMVKIHEMFVDIGATSREDAEETFGVVPGDPVVPDSSFTTLRDGALLAGKAWDDRVGCALAVEVARLIGDDHPNTLIACGTVAEEMGLRGAQTAAAAAKPDVALVLESGIAGDVPGMKSEETAERLGKGPTVFFRESAALPSRRLRELVLAVAAEEDIPVQHGFLEGGSTDARVISVHDQGVPAITIGVTARYIHTHSQIISMADYEDALRLCLALVGRLDAETVAGLTDW
jgi:putative aminopeptidase FrvX